MGALVRVLVSFKLRLVTRFGFKYDTLIFVILGYVKLVSWLGFYYDTDNILIILCR
jgi:hypothetical protein